MEKKINIKRIDEAVKLLSSEFEENGRQFILIADLGKDNLCVLAGNPINIAATCAYQAVDDEDVKKFALALMAGIDVLEEEKNKKEKTEK